MAARRLQLVLDLDTGGYSGKLTQAGSKLRAFDGHVGNTNRTVRDMGRAFEGLNSTLKTPLDRLQSYVMILGNIRLAILNVRDATVGWVGAALKQSSEVERLTMLMKGLSTATSEVGRSEEAADNMRQLFHLSRNTGIEVKTLADSFVKLKTGGIDPMNGSLERLTNAVAHFGGNSDVMHRASIAIQQMGGKGVISMEELRQQLGEAIPTAMNDMARAVGMSTKDFSKQVSLGRVQAAPAIKAMLDEFEAMYSGSGHRMAQTMSGQLAQLKTNVTELTTFFTGLDKEKDGLFSSSKSALAEINAALQSSEGRAMAGQLGDTVNGVMTNIISAGRVLIEWRSEIGFVLTAVATGFAAMKAIDLAGWFINVGRQSVSAMRMSASATTINNAEIAKAVTWMDRWAIAKRRNVGLAQMDAAYAAREIAANNQVAASMQRRIVTMQAHEARARAQIVTSQASVAAATKEMNIAQGYHARNIRNNYAQVESAERVRQAQARLTLATQNLNKARGLASAAASAAAVAETRAAAAANASAVAEGRLAAATTASGVAKQRAAAAASMAASATRGLGIAMNIALGPIGMIATALGVAAYQAGVFENKAKAASRAAAEMMNNINVAENYRTTMEARNKLVAQRNYATGNTNAAVARRNDPYTRARIAELDKQIADLDKKLSYGKILLTAEKGQEIAANIITSRDTALAKASEIHRQNVERIKEKGGSQEQINAANRASLAEFQATRNAWTSNLISDLEKRASKAGAGAKDILLDIISRVRGAGNAAEDTAVSMEELGLAGAGGGGKAAKGMSEAEKAAKKAETAAESARKKYADMIADQAVQIAGLKQELAGGETALGRFNAQLEAGLHTGATAAEIAKLADGFAEIDRLQSDLDFSNSLGRLTKDLTKATIGSDELWRSISAGTYDADLRLQQTREQFEGLLDGITDPDKIAQVNELIDKLTGQRQRADSAELTADLQQQIEEMRLANLSDEEAAKQRFEAEVERKRTLLALDKLSTEERVKAEQVFEQWKRQAQGRMERDNENSVTKMARDWSKLGSNINQAMSGWIDNFVGALGEGKINMGSFAKDIVKELTKIIMKAMIAYAIMSALGLTNNAAGEKVSFSDFAKGQIGAGFGGKTDSKTTIGYKAPVSVPTNHTGGMLGRGAHATVNPSIFAAAKKYHGGGWIGGRQLRQGEVPIIGLDDELVLTKDQQRLLGGQMGGAMSAPAVSVNVINNSGTQLNAEQGEPEFNGREYIINVVVDAANRQGPLRDTLTSIGSS